MRSELGLSGRVAAAFQAAPITPLLALLALLLGLFAILVTPQEEEPQINVTMANVIIPFPGAAVRDVESMVAIPAEQVLAQMAGVEHVMSVSQPGVAVLTVQFDVGVERNDALITLHDTLRSNEQWLPRDLGVLAPITRPMGIDDVPIVGLTLYSTSADTGAYALERIAHSLEVELKRVPGTREVRTIGGPGRAIRVDIDPERLSALGLTVNDLRATLQSANLGLPVGELVSGNSSVQIDAGSFLSSAQEIAELVVSVQDGRAIFLGDVASVSDGPLLPSNYVRFGTVGEAAAEYPAVTMTVTKKPGENAIDVSQAVMQRVAELHNTLIPFEVEVVETRDYGATANEKARKLIQKLIFATLSVVVLVFFALGRREAMILGVAVGLTLAATLFASWAWGFTLNRVSLFALIFSIGILVDDAIVVVENIHRHQSLYPEKTLSEIIPYAVDEVGGPTILATFTVIAALLPMAFVTGLMGPYMSPIPINASMGMVLSLAIAFTLTPWLARLWLRHHHEPAATTAPKEAKLPAFLSRFFNALFKPFLSKTKGTLNRFLLGIGVMLLIAVSLLLPASGLVLLKMLPFDNKSEFQVIVDMPAGTPLEQTSAVLGELGAYLATVPEVTHYQSYAGTAAPINFNGLVRQYYLRSNSESGDIQVNLVDKHHRSEQSHAIATRLRPALQKIGQRYAANVKVVEVPPGPPVLAPIVAEIYGPTAAGRQQVGDALRAVFAEVEGMVDIDDSAIADVPRTLLLIDRHKASQLGVTQADIVSTLRAGLHGEAATWLHDGSKYPASAYLQLRPQLHGDLNTLLQLKVRTASNALVAIEELVIVTDAQREQPIHHKDLLPVHYVMADMAGKVDSPLYGIFASRAAVQDIVTPAGIPLDEYFISQPQDPCRNYALKWDGEWQITYETFRDMGAAYAVGILLIYLLVVAHFSSYLTPLIIMAPIPLTIIGVMPGHAFMGAQYTATSMIGMIALAGIIVRNSILLVDFINLEVKAGKSLEQAVINSAITRAQPIVLTGLAAMLGAFFILDDPIFNGLAISLIFGVLVSTVLTLVVIPLLYYAAYRNKLHLLRKTGEAS